MSSHRCGDSADYAAHLADCDHCLDRSQDSAVEQDWDSYWERSYVPASERERDEP